MRKRIKELKKYRKLGIHTLSEAQEYEEEERRRKEGDFSKRPRLEGSSSGSSVSDRLRANRWTAKQAAEQQAQLEDKRRGRRPAASLDITASPGYELLSEKERELCSVIRLFPQQYMLIKDNLLRESMKNGGLLRRATARQLIKIDVNKTGKIFDFFEANGWINKKVQTGAEDLPPLVNTTESIIPPAALSLAQMTVPPQSVGAVTIGIPAATTNPAFPTTQTSVGAIPPGTNPTPNNANGNINPSNIQPSALAPGVRPATVNPQMLHVTPTGTLPPTALPAGSFAITQNEIQAKK